LIAGGGNQLHGLLDFLHHLGWFSHSNKHYLLVIQHSHGKSPFSIGKPSINGSFSMAMLNNQRVYNYRGPFQPARFDDSGGCPDPFISRDYPIFMFSNHLNHMKRTINRYFSKLLDRSINSWFNILEKTKCTYTSLSYCKP
jgi:hypothetical protein